MNENAISFLTIIIVLLSLYSKGERETAANGKDDPENILDDVILEDRGSDGRTTLLSVRGSVLMGVQSSLKTKATWKNMHLKGTAPQIMEAIELQQVGSTGSIDLASLSVKDTSPSVSSRKTPAVGDLTLSSLEDYADDNFATRGKIMNEPRKPVNRGQSRSKRAKLGHLIPRDTAAGNKSSTNHNLYLPSYHRHNFLNRLQLRRNVNFSNTNESELLNSTSTLSSQQIAKRYVFEHDFLRHLLKREATASTEEYEVLDTVLTKHTAEENGTDVNENSQTTPRAHPVTNPPEGEEFVPGMTKSVFITVTSSSLMITLFVAVVSLYYIRRRRIRMAMDPERQRLIPFRAYTGIYYNQTGPCF